MLRHKYNAKPQTVDGKRFPSKMEAKYYEKLKTDKECLFFLRQVPIDLPGGVKYVIDFQEFRTDGSVVFVDVKGKDTPLSLAKRKIVEDLYPLRSHW